MLLFKASEVPEEKGRRSYPVGGKQGVLHHFALRVTTPANPFGPHTHAGEELWYIVEGQAVASVGGEEQVVGAGDLVVLPSQVEHGLRTDGQVTWICLG